MDDIRIMMLLRERSETGLDAVERKYGAAMRRLSFGITQDKRDAEECVNDAYLALWNSFAEERQIQLLPFLSGIVRNLSYKRVRSKTAGKRAGAVYELTDAEVSEAHDPWAELEALELRGAINEFVRTLTDVNRVMFTRRYMYFDSYAEIAYRLGITEKSVSVRLSKMRGKMREYLSDRGFIDEKMYRKEKKRPVTGFTFTEIPADYEMIASYSEGLAAVLDRKSGRCGFINTKGELVIQPEYTALPDPEYNRILPHFSEGLAAARNDDGLWGYIDKSGECVIPFRYDEAGEFDLGLATVFSGGKMDVINTDGESVGCWEGFVATDFELWCCIRGGKLGFVDAHNNTVIPFIYDYDPRVSQCCFGEMGLSAVSINGKWGFIDRDGMVVIPLELEYDTVSNFGCGLAKVTKDGLCGFIDTSGRLIAELSDMEAEMPMSDRFGENILIKKDGKYFLIGYGGATVAELSEYDHVSQGISHLHVTKDGMHGILDNSGKVIIPPEYERAEFFGKWARVKKDGKWSFTDAGGHVISPFIYDSVGNFIDGTAPFSIDGKYGLLDISGGHIAEPIYDWVFYRYNGYATVEMGGKHGMINTRGELVLPIEYDEITFFDDIGTVRRGGRWWIISEDRS